eukprot:TRINITY_DN6038_c0_g1_i2.p1 TRINITY_DN6038_c0_g1~~TRINITY_DN6038_c0_g1_i2.p1  ORF type:complete len:129 (-),score=21.68 TRINITY_DN6038_c0_g1_i2:12-398(-)
MCIRDRCRSLSRRLPAVSRSSSGLSSLNLSKYPLQVSVKAVLDQPQTLPSEHGTAVALLFEEDVADLAAQGGGDFTPLHAESLNGGKANKVLDIFPSSQDGPSRLVVVGMGPRAVSYTHLTLPTKRIV